MFQFTTTTVINSNQDYTTGKPLWSSHEADAKKPAHLIIKRVNDFLAPNVSAIYKAVATDPELAKVSIDLSQAGTFEDGDVLRLSMYIRLANASQDSRYANDMAIKGKPFSVEFVWKTNAETTLKQLVKTIKKYDVLVYGEKLLNVDSKTNFLTIEATNEFQRFHTVNIEKLDRAAYAGMGDFKVVRSLEDIVTKNTNAEVLNTAEGFFAGKEGFGTYSYLLHNLRLPTEARTRAFATNQDETPIVGAKYNQYTIHYCVNRGILGDNAVGDVVKSMTTHVFYVKSDLATSFEEALGKIGTITEVTGPNTPDPVVHEMIAGNGIEIKDNTISVKLDGNSLEASANGLKVKA